MSKVQQTTSLFHPSFMSERAVGLMTSISETEAAKFGDVALHSQRVADSAGAFGVYLEMASDEVELLRFGARLHDVGKLVIDPAILNKQGPLTERERAEMEKHAIYGADILTLIPEVHSEIIEIAQFHHERYDGYGYENLAGETIPFKARIVQICDVHDALRSARPYKAGMPEALVLQIMTADEPSPKFGRRNFDPALMRAFVAYRLEDPTFEATREQREALGFYSVSDPMLDLPIEVQQSGIIEFGDTGERRIYEIVSGKPQLFREVELNGMVVDHQAVVAAPAISA